MSPLELPPELDTQMRSWTVGDLASLLEPGARPLLVVDEGARRACDDPIRDLAPRATFSDFTPNPTSDQGRRAASLAREVEADVIVAFGGGSCIDVAKFAAATARRDVEDADLTRLPEDLDAVPIIAIPTTSGTGSEATHFAAIYRDGTKCSLAHPALRPVACILDVSLHRRMPPRLAACAGLDALCQACESSWAVGSTTASRLASALAMRHLVPHLVRSVRDADPDARRQVMLGAHLAGIAIDVAMTTAPHAISYQLTSRRGIPHGHAVALTFGHVARLNHAVTTDTLADPRGTAHVRERVEDLASALDTTPERLPERMRTLLIDLDLAPTLGDAGLRSGDLADIAARVDPVRLSNNPRRLTRDDLESLLREAF
ncbi:MAG: phosphonoacetaldehyde reductase [Phycisphaerales bacterium]|nr:phosphonoacetaldehyde reductase [Phycisphaerales bacterium]